MAAPFVIVLQDVLGDCWVLLSPLSDPNKETVMTAFISQQEANDYIMKLLGDYPSPRIKTIYTVKVTNWEQKLLKHIQVRHDEFMLNVMGREVSPKILHKSVTEKVLGLS